MASKIEIMNLALLQLGDEIIMSLDEDTKAARTMKVLWDATLREVLEDHTWGFARKRASLGLLGSAPTYQWDYAYKLPSDYIRMVTMGEYTDEYLWSIEGEKLVTNELGANILYISYISDTTKFSPKFVSALACLLAARAADSIAGLDSGKKKEALSAYEKVLMDAETVDTQNSPSPIQQPTRWVNSRY
jgi:hypothetical protein